MSSLQDNTAEALAVVRFRIADHHFAMEARAVEGMSREPGPCGAPLETLLGLPVASDTARRWLAIRGSQRRLGISEPVELDSIAASALRPLPPLLQCRPLLPALAAMALEGAQLSLLLDPCALPDKHTTHNNSELEMQP